MILVVATTGEGDATDNARKFNRFITSKTTMTDVFIGLKYAVFGLGDLNYINFNQMGKRTELNMDRLGATKIYPRGIGDASQDIEADLRRWIDGGFLEAVRENVPNLTRTGSKPVVVLKTGLPDLLNMVNLKQGELAIEGRSRGTQTLSKVFWSLSTGSVTNRSELRQEFNESSSTMQISVQLPEGTIYEPCDTIEILPENSPELVHWIAKYLELTESDLDQIIDFEPTAHTGTRKLPFPTPCTVRAALTKYLDLAGCPSKTFISNLAVLNRDNSELEEALYALASNSAIMKDMSTDYLLSLPEFFDLFTHCFKAKIKTSLSEFLQIGPKQRLRAYTGASCLQIQGKVDLVVSLTCREKISLEPLFSNMVEAGIFSESVCPLWARQRGAFKGLASDFLCNRILVGSEISLRVRESNLRPPPQSNTPILCIAAGAGIAPVLAYIDECHRRGGGWFHSFFLVFGCQSSQTDFIYKEKILKLQEEGKVRCWFAFSREGPRKVYVQDLIKETRDIHKIIGEIHSKGGRILVCGSTAMGRGVCEVVAAQIGGQAQLEILEKTGRLVVEYFG